MSDSVLMWMKKNERRHAQLRSLAGHRHLGVTPESSPASEEEHSIEEINRPKKSPQQTLDAFIKPPKADLFDDSFSLEDFRAMTRQWKAKNAVAMP